MQFRVIHAVLAGCSGFFEEWEECNGLCLRHRNYRAYLIWESIVDRDNKRFRVKEV